MQLFGNWILQASYLLFWLHRVADGYGGHKGKDHQTLGKGNLDTSWLLQRLGEYGFDGTIIFELRIDDALDSLKVIREGGFRVEGGGLRVEGGGWRVEGW